MKIRVTLGQRLANLATASFRDRVAAWVLALHEQLHIPGADEVTVGGDAARTDPISIAFDDVALRVPPSSGLDADAPEHRWASWIATVIYAYRERFVTSAVVAKIQAQRGFTEDDAEVGVTLRQLVRYCLHLDRLVDEPGAYWFERSVWNLDGIRIALHLPVGAAREGLLGGTGEHVENERLGDALEMMQLALQYQSGVLVPSAEIVEIATLDAGTFQIAINDLAFPTETSLSSDQLFGQIDAKPEVPGLGSTVPPGARPATLLFRGVPGYLVSRADPTRAFHRVYDTCGIAAIETAFAMKQFAPALLCGALVSYELEQLASTEPMLVRAARERIGEPRLVQILRLLLEEGMPIIDRKAILESLLLVDAAATAEVHRQIVFAAEPGAVFVTARSTHGAMGDGDLADVVRVRLRRHIPRDADQRRQRPVLLLEAGLERRLADPAAPLDPTERQRVLDSLARQAGPSGVVVTTPGVRRVFKELFSIEFPALTVLALDELEREAAIMPVGTVAL